MSRRVGGVILMVCATLTVGAIAAATANFAGWRMATPSPTIEEATAAVQVGLPGTEIDEIGWHDDVHDVHFMEHPRADNLPGQQEVYIQGGATSRDAFDQACERLAQAGWRTEAGSSTVQGGGFFVASRGDLVMEWKFRPSGTFTEPPGDSIEVWVWRFTPPRVKALTVVGWLLGAALGWWLARSILRLTNSNARTSSTVVAYVLVVVLALSTLVATYLTAHNLIERPGWGQPVAVWTAYFPFLLPFGVFTPG
ncbi:MAG TPA: hypothetical protein VFX60_05525 [Micromonospora sp.]|nr:hypothetical protein [Micromonospora sp.]